MEEYLYQAKARLQRSDFLVIKGVYELVNLVFDAYEDEATKFDLIKKLLSDSVFLN